MKIPFRQGIVRHRVDSAGNPGFLQKSNSGTTVDLIASVVEPTVVAFAHGNSDYLFEEFASVTPAWLGPFSAGTDFWLFWDLSLTNNATRTFGHTTLAPVFGPTAPTGLEGQHWFDTNVNVMKVFTNGIFKEVVRLFAAKYEQGAILKPFEVGSQVNIDQTTFAGTILFDDEDNVIRKFGPRRRTEFITSESQIATFSSNQAVNLTFGEAAFVAEAVGAIPEFHLVAYNDQNKIELASSADNKRVVGLVVEDLADEESGTFVFEGFLSSLNFSFAEDPGTLLFCSVSGQVTTSVPQTGFIKRIGHVVNATTIFLEIQPQIELQDS
ncbi:hypothetical protein LCGC14_0919160 [marine sediment metagenome]|uniref:Uncharacterized protein n=1 Tax=marine sediment metagenome TaxID=412755 RepID=A0A0F9NW50_9ZZZZ